MSTAHIMTLWCRKFRNRCLMCFIRIEHLVSRLKNFLGLLLNRKSLIRRGLTWFFGLWGFTRGFNILPMILRIIIWPFWLTRVNYPFLGITSLRGRFGIINVNAMTWTRLILILNALLTCGPNPNLCLSQLFTWTFMFRGNRTICSI